MPTFDDVFTALKGAVVSLASKSFANAKDAAVKDGQPFLEKTRADLEQWTGQAAAGELKASDLAYLVEAKKDLATMNLLKQAGIAQIELDRYEKDLVNTVVGTMTKMLGLG